MYEDLGPSIDSTRWVTAGEHVDKMRGNDYYVEVCRKVSMYGAVSAAGGDDAGEPRDDVTEAGADDNSAAGEGSDGATPMSLLDDGDNILQGSGISLRYLVGFFRSHVNKTAASQCSTDLSVGTRMDIDDIGVDV